jgi:hypothetical protein
MLHRRNRVLELSLLGRAAAWSDGLGNRCNLSLQVENSGVILRRCP